MGYIKVCRNGREVKGLSPAAFKVERSGDGEDKAKVTKKVQSSA